MLDARLLTRGILQVVSACEDVWNVVMQVSNVEVYYRAVSFYLEQHPDLLVDLLKVCASAFASHIFPYLPISSHIASHIAFHIFQMTSISYIPSTGRSTALEEYPFTSVLRFPAASALALRASQGLLRSSLQPCAEDMCAPCLC